MKPYPTYQTTPRLVTKNTLCYWPVLGPVCLEPGPKACLAACFACPTPAGPPSVCSHTSHCAALHSTRKRKCKLIFKTDSNYSTIWTISFEQILAISHHTLAEICQEVFMTRFSMRKGFVCALFLGTVDNYHPTSCIFLCLLYLSGWQIFKSCEPHTGLKVNSRWILLTNIKLAWCSSSVNSSLFILPTADLIEGRQPTCFRHIMSVS